MRSYQACPLVKCTLFSFNGIEIFAQDIPLLFVLIKKPISLSEYSTEFPTANTAPGSDGATASSTLFALIFSYTTFQFNPSVDFKIVPAPSHHAFLLVPTHNVLSLPISKSDGW